MKTVIESHMSRKFSVEDGWNGATHITVTDTVKGTEIVSKLLNLESVDLGKDILKAAGKTAFVFEGGLPGVGTDGGYYVSGQGSSRIERHVTYKSENAMAEIKALIAIHNKLVAEEEYRKSEEFRKAEAARKLSERRDTLVNLFAGTNTRSYGTATEILKGAVDYAIELEDKLEEAGKSV